MTDKSGKALNLPGKVVPLSRCVEPSTKTNTFHLSIFSFEAIMEPSFLWAVSPYTVINHAIAFEAIFVFSLLNIPPSLKERAGSVVLLAILTYSFQTSLPTWTANRNLRGILVSGAWTIFWHALELLLVSKATSKDLDGNRTLIGNFGSAASLLWKWRRIGTKWQIEKIAKFNSEGRVPNRAQFLLRMTLVGLACYFFLDFIASTPAQPDMNMIIRRKESLFSRLSEVSAQELVFRSISSLVFAASACIGVNMVYNLIAVLAVLTGLSTPAECPPAYQSFKEAYTVRRYWG